MKRLFISSNRSFLTILLFLIGILCMLAFFPAFTSQSLPKNSLFFVVLVIIMVVGCIFVATSLFLFCTVVMYSLCSIWGKKEIGTIVKKDIREVTFLKKTKRPRTSYMYSISIKYVDQNDRVSYINRRCSLEYFDSISVNTEVEVKYYGFVNIMNNKSIVLQRSYVSEDK